LDCAQIVASSELMFQDWKRWNILAYLEQIQRTRGVEVLVINRPAAHEPVGACYNARFTTASFEDHLAWVGPQVQARGLYYLDLHDSLPRDAILDSQHLTAEGHRLMAEEVARGLDPILPALAQRRRAPLASP
jgi:lysophospholipase L1-like esterase